MKTESIRLSGGSHEPVLREFGEYAVEQGYVEKPYVDTLLEREEEFPTGLEIPREAQSFGVAIPHADPDYVNESAVLLGLPEGTATFQSMDNKDKEIEVNAVILLLVTETEGYSTFLSNMTELFREDEFADYILAKDAEATIALIVEHALKR